MTEDYDWDVYDTFKDQIDSQLPFIEYNILVLNQEDLAKDALDELFRYFHSYKAASSYLSLTPLCDLSSKAEAVLGSLRDGNSTVQDAIVEWLIDVKKQLEAWSLEMDNEQTLLSPAAEELLNKIKITKPYTASKDKLKSLSILYMDRNIQRAKKVVPFLRKLSHDVKFSSESDKNNTVLNMNPYDIIMTNLDKDNHSVISFCKHTYPGKPIIAIFNKIDAICSKKLLQSGISHAIENPLNAKAIERELISIVKVFYSSVKILIDNKKINNFINNLQPLPNTIFQIMQICDDDDIPVKELIKVVKTDPIIAGNILNVANSPIYTSVHIKTIDQAVTKFGKKAIKALSMSGLYSSLGTIDLSAYGIDEESFSTVSMSRLSIMLKWYSKVSISDLSVLSSTALLGNIGQLLISKELLESDLNEKFLEMCSTFDIQYVEESMVHTTTAHISSQILRHWKLSDDIVEIISYSDNPKEAPQELRKLCVANHIVYKLIDINGKILFDIPDELLLLMDEFNLDHAPLKKALESLR